MARPTAQATFSHIADAVLTRVRNLRPGSRAAVASAVFLATIARGTGVRVHDADAYWNMTGWLLRLDGWRQLAEADMSALFELRGVMTAVIFAPSALATDLVGSDYGPFFVLLQNAAFIAWIAAYLMPKLTEMAGSSRGNAGRHVIAFATWLILSGFAPFSLVDVYAAGLALATVALLSRTSRRHLLLAGILAAVAMNLRPAYTPVFVILGVLVVVRNRRRGIYAFLGGAIGALPQLVFNAITRGTLISSAGTTDLIALQAGYASYIVRYDTVLGPTPQQFFCSPTMAEHAIGDLPRTTGELAGFFLETIPDSLVFALQKLGAALLWPHAVPYGNTSPGLDAVFAVTVSAITVIGIGAHIRHLLRGRRDGFGEARFRSLAMIAMSFTTALVLVGSAMETRFALLIVMCGVAGLPLLKDPPPVRPDSRRALAFPVGMAAAVVGLLILGHTGLAYPAPAGGVDASVCAALPHG